MSSPAVRDAIRAAWPTLVPTIPLVETINDTPETLEIEVPIWATLVFDVTNRGPVTMGSHPWIEETGMIVVALMSYSGTGDDEVARAAGVIMQAFEMWISPDKAIWIQSVDGPRSPDMEAGGNVYRLSVNLNYAYQTRGG
jgi:hypothetical protein